MPPKKKRKIAPKEESGSDDDAALGVSRHVAVDEVDQTFVIVYIATGETPFGNVHPGEQSEAPSSAMTVSSTEFIGKGHFSRAVCCTLAKKNATVGAVVLKKCLLEYSDSARIAAREWYFLTRTAEVPNIIHLTHSYIVGQHLYLCLPRYHSTVANVLDSVRKDDQTATLLDAMECVLGVVGSALCSLHRLGVMHRDVKPSNILVNLSSSDPPVFSDVVLADFGSAIWINRSEHDSDSDSDSAKQTPCHDVTTQPYIAPEAVDDNEYGAEVDMWALGCIGSEMVTGKVLFQGKQLPLESFRNCQERVIKEELAALHAAATASMKTALKGLLAIPPAKRFTAAQLMKSMKVTVKEKGFVKCPPMPTAEGACSDYLHKHVEVRQVK